MQLLLDENKVIINYAVVGGFDNGFQINDEVLPPSFKEEFAPKKYKLIDGQISFNENYIPIETEENETSIELPIGTDDTLREMFANFQRQNVQANMMVYQLTQQNADLAKQNAQFEKRLAKLENGGSTDA